MPRLWVEFVGEGALRDAVVATEVLDASLRRVRLYSAPLLNAEPLDLAAGVYVVRAYLPSGGVTSAQVPVDDDDCTATLEIGAASEQPWAYALAGGTLWAPSVTAFGYSDATWSATAIDTAFAMLGFEPAETIRAPAEPAWLSFGNDVVAVPADRTAHVILMNGRSDITVQTASPLADAVVGYLDRGQFGWAGVVAKSFFESGISEHLGSAGDFARNPSAAAALGYYAIRALDLTALLAWQRRMLELWCEMLVEIAPDLPDLYVVRGWMRLKNGKPDEAESDFVAACERGTPFSTMGLRYLLDGLRLIGARDAQSARAESWLTGQAQRADWTSPLTRLRQTEPPERLLGAAIFVGPALRQLVHATMELAPWTPHLGGEALETVLALRGTPMDVRPSLRSLLDIVSADPSAAPRVGSFHCARATVAERPLEAYYEIDNEARTINVFKLTYA